MVHLSHIFQQVWEMKEFRCYEMKIEESEKAGSHWELNQGHLWLEPPVLSHALSHNRWTATNPHNSVYVYIYICTAGLFTFLYFHKAIEGRCSEHLSVEKWYILNSVVICSTVITG